MRLGTSGFGVIAVVSLLVTAAPERTDGKEDRGGIDSSITWPVSVVSAISRIGPIRSRFVKIEEQDIQSGSLTSKTSSTVPPFRPQRSTLPLSVVQNTETPTKLPRYLDGLSTRVPRQIRNSKRSSTKTDDWLVPVESVENGKSNVEESASRNSSNLAMLGNFDVGFIAENSSSRSSTFRATPLAHLSSVLHRYARHRSREGETREEGNARGSTWKRNEMTGDVEATTSYQLRTWMTSATKKNITPDKISAVAIFREPTEHYESQIVRNTPASEFAKDNVQSGFVNDSAEPVSQFSDETMPSPDKDVLRHPAGHQISQRSYVPSQTTDDSRVNDRGLRIPFIGDLRIDKLAAPDFTSSNYSGQNGSRQQSSTYEPASLEKRRSSTPRTLDQVTLRKHETEYGIVEETIRARRITHETFSDVPIFEREATYQGIADNANGVDLLVPSKYNHKAIGARSFHTTSVENEKQGNSPTGVSSFPSRFSKRLGNKDTPDFETSPLADKTSSLAANQIIPAKSGYPNAKNNTGQSINFLDGKSKKIFYEIKPSVITDTDRLDDLDLPITTTITTTTRHSFDKFLLSSVPSVYGKFGPYFIDEEDRRNVTERIGSTVQLDCRIGFLGDRKVTWLHDYKDSFRLLTVKKESYSVDRRISLNFQYPDNWRLQIAYASIRDSGLYKCQVEIDLNKSLVKRYYVLITAPTLTITDDSGRPVSGERHLKAGSALKLRCEARDVIPGLNESVLWMRGDETLTDDVSENRTTEIVDEREITVIISTLLVDRAAPTHAGNYSCVVPDKARTTIAVHVLNGELPAAVQHGSGVSTAVLNIWLIHLTASYGFLR